MIDVSSWVVMVQEPRGQDPKDWIVEPGQVELEGEAHWWMFKPVKSARYRRMDDWAEKVACELAGLIDLPAARVEFAQGVNTAGIISRNVTPNGWDLIPVTPCSPRHPATSRS